jgi:hypothetical protein
MYHLTVQPSKSVNVQPHANKLTTRYMYINARRKEKLFVQLSVDPPFGRCDVGIIQADPT